MSKYLWKEIDSDLDKIMSKCEHIERNEDRKRIYFVGRTFKNAKIIVHFRRKNSLTRKEMITDICILDEVRNRFSFSVCFSLSACLRLCLSVCLSFLLPLPLSLSLSCLEGRHWLFAFRYLKEKANSYLERNLKRNYFGSVYTVDRDTNKLTLRNLRKCKSKIQKNVRIWKNLEGFQADLLNVS